MTRVVWITGLSGVGKTTVGAALRDQLIVDDRIVPVLLDGDVLRRIMARGLAFDEQSRRSLAITYAHLATEIARQGHIVIVSTISMFHDVRSWNAVNAPGYCEVWLRAPNEVLAARGGATSYLGPSGTPHMGAEFPRTPDLVIDNWGLTSPDMAALSIHDYLNSQS